LARAMYIGVYMQGWPGPFIYGVYTVFLAGKSPNIRSYTVYIYGSGQPYIYGMLAYIKVLTNDSRKTYTCREEVTEAT